MFIVYPIIYISDFLATATARCNSLQLICVLHISQYSYMMFLWLIRLVTILDPQRHAQSDMVVEEKGAELETQIQEEEELINEEIKKTESEKKKEKAVDMRLCNGEMFWIKSVSLEAKTLVC